MTIDIHALLEKNPITRNMLKQKFGYKYLSAYNPLNKQLLYNKQTGDIYIYIYIYIYILIMINLKTY